MLVADRGVRSMVQRACLGRKRPQFNPFAPTRKTGLNRLEPLERLNVRGEWKFSAVFVYIAILSFFLLKRSAVKPS